MTPMHTCKGCGYRTDWAELRNLLIREMRSEGVSVRTIYRVLTTPTPMTPALRPETILEQVAWDYGVPVDVIKGRGLTRPIVVARCIAMYRLREETDLPLKAIGRMLGNRDHSTAWHGVKKGEKYLAVTPKLGPTAGPERLSA